VRFHNDPEMVATLRAMRRRGSPSADMLRYLDGRGLSSVEMTDHFREAFDLDGYDAGPIGGWFADGTGELGDEAVSDLLDPAIAAREGESGADRHPPHAAT